MSTVRVTSKRTEDHGTQSQIGTYFTKGIRFRELAQAIERSGHQKLLVIGCGNGYLESILSESISIHSIDISERALEVARSLNKGKANRAFQSLDVYDLSKEKVAAPFSGVVISEVLEHLDDDVTVLKLASDLLASDGALFLTVPNVTRLQNRPRTMLGLKPKYMSEGHLREYTLESSLDLVRRAGFQCDQVSGLDLWFPKDPLVRFIVPFGSPIRHRVASRWPNLAVWYFLQCSKG